MDKTWNNKAWFLVLPVLVLVAFSAIIPLMTVVNYSVQDTFGNNQFFWNGPGWYAELLDPSSELGGRFWAALGSADTRPASQSRRRGKGRRMARLQPKNRSPSAAVARAAIVRRCRQGRPMW